MCTDCGETESVVIENYETCINCGLQGIYTPKYYTSYALPRREVRRQYYSRVKRFRKVLYNMKSEIIGNSFEKILEMYTLLVFIWNVKKDKERKYFFSQKMVLWFILKTLDIPLSVPVLKNHDRGTKQIQAIEKMLKTQGAGLTLAFDIILGQKIP